MTTTLIEERALQQHIRRRTVRLLDLTDKSCGGSGVAIKLGKRFFLATAAHVIPSGHDIRILVGEGHDKDIWEFLAWHLDEEDDVGLLELEEHIARAIHREFTDSTQLATRVEQSSPWAATLLGYPGQLVETESTKTGDTLRRTHSFRTLTLVTQLIPFSAWPDSGPFQRRSPRNDSDVFVRFDSKLPLYEQNLVDLDRSESSSEFDEVTLAGMSGCGIWLDSYSHSGLWRPAPALVGITTGAKSQGWARGTQIRRWLRLVVRHYNEFTEIARQLDADT